MTDRSPDAPLFILAPPRSYTSVACAMIGQHPAMFGLPEVNLFAADTVGELLDLFCERPGLGHGLLRATAELGLGEQTTETVDIASVWLDEYGDTACSEVFRDLSAWAGPRRLVDKSPIYALRPDALARLRRSCSDAYYLHLTRHPVTTLDSLTRFRTLVRDRYGLVRFAEAAPGPQDLERFWREPHERIDAFLADVPDERRLRIRGEDLLAEPASHLSDIARWLGIDDAPDSLSAMLHPERSAFAGEGPPAARFGNDPEFLARPELRPPSSTTPLRYHAMSESVTELARHLGYGSADAHRRAAL